MSTRHYALIALAVLSGHLAPAQVQNDNINYRLAVSDTWADCTAGAEVGLEDASLTAIPALNGTYGAPIHMGWEVDEMGYGGSFNNQVLLDQYNISKNSYVWVDVSGWEWDNFGSQWTYDPNYDDCYMYEFGIFSNGSDYFNITTDSKPNVWDMSIGYNSTNNLVGFQTQWGLYVRSIWSFVHGRTASDPLQFGQLSTGSVLTHTNSNRLAPYSFGANADFGTDQGSTYYEFSISERSFCTISATASLGFDLVLRLKDSFGSDIEVEDSWGAGSSEAFDRYLCPGTYTIVVEGYNGSVGDFTLGVIKSQGSGTIVVDVNETTAATCGLGNGAAEAVLVSGNQLFPLQYTWLDANGNTVGTGSSMSGLFAGSNFLVYSDQCGGIGTISFTQSEVPDVIAPTAQCQSTFSLDVPDWGGPMDITAAQVNAGSTDNCAISSYSLSEQTFDASDAGPNQVILTVTDAAGNASTCTCTVNVTVVTGIGEEPSVLAPRPYPNPSDGSFTLDLSDTDVNAGASAWVTDPAGRTVHTQLVQRGLNEFDLGHLSKGIYSLEISAGGSRSSARLVIQ